MAASPRIVIRVLPETLEALQERASREGRTPSNLARNLIERGIRTENIDHGDMMNLVMNALWTDGAHHKQWFLRRIAERIGLDASRSDEGVAP